MIYAFMYVCPSLGISVASRTLELLAICEGTAGNPPTSYISPLIPYPHPLLTTLSGWWERVLIISGEYLDLSLGIQPLGTFGWF